MYCQVFLKCISRVRYRFFFWFRDVYATRPADQRRQRPNGDDGSASRFALEHLLRELLAVLVLDNSTKRSTAWCDTASSLPTALP